MMVEEQGTYSASTLPVGNIECIDFIDSCGYGLDFCLANAIKYLTRCKHKGTTVQDIRKAIWYANHAAEKLEEGVYETE